MKSSLFSIRMFLALALLAVALFGLSPLAARAQVYFNPPPKRAGITKRIGWHTFRHSLATLLGNKGEGLKVVQGILRHASSKITADDYQHGDVDADRLALAHTSALFADTPTTIN